MQADPSVYQCDHHDRGYSLGLAAYRIARCGGERFSRLGSKKKSGLQGLAGEVLAICKRGWLACWILARSQCSGPQLRHLSVCDEAVYLIGARRVSGPLANIYGASCHEQTSSSCSRAATRLIGLEHRDFSVDS